MFSAFSQRGIHFHRHQYAPRHRYEDAKRDISPFPSSLWIPALPIWGADPLPGRSKVVTSIYQGYLSGKKRRGDCQGNFPQQQVPKLRGIPVWSPTGISYILTNERYMGDEQLQNGSLPTDSPTKKVKNRGEKKSILRGKHPRCYRIPCFVPEDTGTAEKQTDLARAKTPSNLPFYETPLL